MRYQFPVDKVDPLAPIWAVPINCKTPALVSLRAATFAPPDVLTTANSAFAFGRTLK